MIRPARDEGKRESRYCFQQELKYSVFSEKVKEKKSRFIPDPAALHPIKCELVAQSIYVV